jgi:hypothetical protein
MLGRNQISTHLKFVPVTCVKDARSPNIPILDLDTLGSFRPPSPLIVNSGFPLLWSNFLGSVLITMAQAESSPTGRQNSLRLLWFWSWMVKRISNRLIWCTRWFIAILWMDCNLDPNSSIFLFDQLLVVTDVLQSLANMTQVTCTWKC